MTQALLHAGKKLFGPSTEVTQIEGQMGLFGQDRGGAGIQPEQTVLWHGAYRDQTRRDPADHNRIVCIHDEPLYDSEADTFCSFTDTSIGGHKICYIKFFRDLAELNQQTLLTFMILFFSIYIPDI